MTADLRLVAAAGAGLDITEIKQLGDGLGFYALLVAVAGIFISAGMWAIGRNSANSSFELSGKRGIVVCCVAAFLVGALPGWMAWLDDQAQAIDPSVATPVEVVK